MGRIRKLVLKMPHLKNAFLQFKKVKEWRNHHHFLKSDLFKPDMEIQVNFCKQN